MTPVRSLTRTVGGQSLNVRPDTPDEVREDCKASVEARIAHVAGGTRSGSDARVLLLVAMSLAEELRREKQTLATLSGRLRERAENALRDLESTGV
jgi:cell division protein ZapA (FtsZ GTPase activity inhibitor)